MANGPHCKQQLNLNDVHKETAGVGFLKQEIMYSYPHCHMILGFIRGNYR